MDIRVYTLGELEPHLHILYSRPEALVPVSPLRLRSYLENPRARPDDPVLFEMSQNDQVIAYRTLLPDWFYDRHGQPRRFAWLSGNWVQPDMRRQGLSTRLLEMAEEHWQGRLMYTNYAPESKAVYDRTGHFELIASREGKRYYLRAAAEDLRSLRSGPGKVLGFTDNVINRIQERRLRRYKFSTAPACQVECVEGFISQLSELVKKLQQDALFRRDREIFEWALKYPWVTEQACDTLHYHFSYQANRFENRLLQFTVTDGGKNGILWLIIHNNTLSAPYFFAGDPGIYTCMADTLLRTMIETGCTHVTIRNPKLLAPMQAHSSIFLMVRKMPQLIFAHQSLIDQLPEERVIHDGDGDVMFTG